MRAGWVNLVENPLEAPRMKLEGIHHVSSITGDAQANVDFYAGTLGLRLVKKTVNQDDPTVYHLFYGDDKGSPGLDLTFFEYPGTDRGRAGQGMIHRIVLRVGSEAALDFWERRLATGERSGGSLVFSDPEGLGLELRVVDSSDAPLTASHPEIPAEHAILGFEEVRAYTSDPEASRGLLEGALGFERAPGSSWQARGESRGGAYVFDRAPAGRGVPGAGTVPPVARAELTRRRSSTATGSSRCTFESRAAFCSRSPRWAQGLRWTRIPRISASAWCCRRSSKACETSSKPR